MLKKVIVDPVTNACEVDDQKDGACMALIYSMRNPGRRKYMFLYYSTHGTHHQQLEINVPILLRFLIFLDGVIERVFNFVGLPGTGQASLSQSITRAFNLPGSSLYRVALGDVRHEAEKRCHRRHYVYS
jgi:hypothetical protein